MNPYNTTSTLGDINSLGLFQGLWYKLMFFMPQFLGALMILIAGFVLASLVASLVRQAIRLSRIDQLAEKTGISKLFSDVGIIFTFSGLISWIVKFFLIIISLIVAADVLGWDQVTLFLNKVALYIPNMLVAAVIVSIGFVAGHFVSQMIQKSNVTTPSISSIAKWSIIVFSILAGLMQLGIATRLIEILFAGIVAALALAFGLGGREHAARLLSKLEQSNANTSKQVVNIENTETKKEISPLS